MSALLIRLTRQIRNRTDPTIEIRRGFADPAGELLAVLDRPLWRRIGARRKRALADELVRVCAESGAREVEAWRAAPRPLRHIIGYWP